MVNSEVQRNYWAKIQNSFMAIGYPLRPSTVDMDIFMRQMALGRDTPVNALILGVTPELYNLDWPEGTTVMAADQSQQMIDTIWPGPKGSVLRCNWVDIPFPEDTFDIVLLDGGLSLLCYPHTQTELAQSVSRILKPGGKFVTRAFTLPDEPETADQIVSQLFKGDIDNVNALKMFLAMALIEDTTVGVRLSDVYDTLLKHIGDLSKLSELTNWTSREIETLSKYRDSENHYFYTAECQVVEIFTADGTLTFASVERNPAQFGERCPIISFGKN